MTPGIEATTALDPATSPAAAETASGSDLTAML
jgi:hypothetical protein